MMLGNKVFLVWSSFILNLCLGRNFQTLSNQTWIPYFKVAALDQNDYTSQAQTVTHPAGTSVSVPEYLGKNSGPNVPEDDKAVSITTEWLRLIFNISGENNSSYVSREKNQSKTRRRRYEYEDTYDWDQSGLDYDIPKKENLMDKIVKNWQKVALKCIFLFCFLMTLICCCVGVCRKCCQHCWRSCLSHVRYYCDLCRCGDPAYRRVKELTEAYGIKLDYETYKKIKSEYQPILVEHSA